MLGKFFRHSDTGNCLKCYLGQLALAIIVALIILPILPPPGNKKQKETNQVLESLEKQWDYVDEQRDSHPYNYRTCLQPCIASMRGDCRKECLVKIEYKDVVAFIYCSHRALKTCINNCKLEVE